MQLICVWFFKFFVCPVECPSKFFKDRRLKGDYSIDLTGFAVMFYFVLFLYSALLRRTGKNNF